MSACETYPDSIRRCWLCTPLKFSDKEEAHVNYLSSSDSCLNRFYTDLTEGKYPQMHTIHIVARSVPEECLKFIVEHMSTVFLEHSDVDTMQHFVNLLCDNRVECVLNKIALYAIPIENLGAGQLSQALRKRPSIKHLTFSCHLKVEQGWVFAHRLSESHVEEIIFESIHSNSWGRFSDELSKPNCALKRLSLTLKHSAPDNDVENGYFGDAFARAFESPNFSLKELTMSTNFSTKPWLGTVLSKLHCQKSLQKLSLHVPFGSYTLSGDEISLTPFQLHELDLSVPYIDIRALSAIVEASCDALKILRIKTENTPWGVDEVSQLTKLINSSKLQEIDIQGRHGDDISEAYERASDDLFQALRVNKHLQKITMWFNFACTPRGFANFSDNVTLLNFGGIFRREEDKMIAMKIHKIAMRNQSAHCIAQEMFPVIEAASKSMRGSTIPAHCRYRFALEVWKLGCDSSPALDFLCKHFFGMHEQIVRLAWNYVESQADHSVDGLAALIRPLIRLN